VFRVNIVRISKHRDPIQVARFRTFGRQPDVDDLLRQSGADKTGAKRQHVGIVVLAAVAGARQIVGERRSHIRYLVCDHARPDPGAVDHDTDVGSPLRYRLGDRSGIDRIVDRFTG
jgi:hypothetical protein